MWRRSLVSLFLILPLVALGSGCEPIDRSGAAPQSVAAERLPGATELPAEYGRLIDVTTTPGYREDFAQLWFVDDAGTLRIVYYHFRDRALDPRVDVIRRAAAHSLVRGAGVTP
jgi:hypothetical protein